MAENAREEHVINLDAAPEIPEGWSVHDEDQVEGRATGKLIWEPSKVLSISVKILPGLGHDAHKAFREALKGQPVLGDSAFNYFRDHQRVIPKSWGSGVGFFGTIFRNEEGVRCVRTLYLTRGMFWEFWDTCPEELDGSFSTVGGILILAR